MIHWLAVIASSSTSGISCWKVIFALESRLHTSPSTFASGCACQARTEAPVDTRKLCSKEIAARMMAARSRFFCDVWNVVDLRSPESSTAVRVFEQP